MRRMTCFVLLVAVMALGLGACGVKGDPKHPDGSNYPRTYPAN